MKILFVSDHESPFLWDYYQPGRLKDYDLIVSCGDLSPSYLSFLVTRARWPLLYVHGNHDTSYSRNPPEGCDCIEDKLFTYKGLRILGLGGSPYYNGGEHQYTERDMQRRIFRLAWKLYRAGGVDIVVTHAPVRGYGDGEDLVHQGFECLIPLLDKYKPKYLIHGHVHPNYGVTAPRVLHHGETTIVNAYDRYVLDI